MSHSFNLLRILLAAAAAGACAVSAIASTAQDETVVVFDKASIQWTPPPPPVNGAAPEEPAPADRPYGVLHRGQTIERRLALPAPPADLRDTRRIVAVIEVDPVVVERDGKASIADPWTRLGHLFVLQPAADPAQPGTPIELARFITGFGGSGRFEQDVTAYAPLLHGESTLRINISTWTSPAWTVSMRLEYRAAEAGYRRPAVVMPVLATSNFTAKEASRKVSVSLAPPRAITMPRLVVHTSGHGGPQEFMTATHILLVDGVEIARWRPWREDGGTLHEQNPTSWKGEIEGRTLWSADIDRAGWMPGDLVEPIRIPLPDVAPGTHDFELRIEGIHAATGEGGVDGYWVVSITLVADEPWPAGEIE